MSVICRDEMAEKLNVLLRGDEYFSCPSSDIMMPTKHDLDSGSRMMLIETLAASSSPLNVIPAPKHIELCVTKSTRFFGAWLIFIEYLVVQCIGKGPRSQ